MAHLIFLLGISLKASKSRSVGAFSCRKPTDESVRRVERIKLGQVKSAGETEENMYGGDTTRYRD